MSKLKLSVAMGNYDRTRALVDEAVQIDGVDPVYQLLSPEEMFFRAFRHGAFDICELSLSSFAVKSASGTNPYVGVPIFPSRAFRHTCIYVRTDRGIREPVDLRGRRIGTPEYQLTACVWARALLQDDYGINPSDIQWVRGGMDHPGRPEKIPLRLPDGERIESAPEGVTLSQLLERGEIDGIIGPRAPACFLQNTAPVGWLFADPAGTAADYFRRTRIFPIMHLIGVRQELTVQHPWLPMAVYKAFCESKRLAVAALEDTSATKVMLPFVDEQLRAARRLMGPDFWSYGFAPNRTTLKSFLHHHYVQGLSQRCLPVEELFHPSTLGAHRI